MLPLKFAYLTGTTVFFIPWLILFWHRKNLRTEMIAMGLISGIASFVTAYFWTIDWWKPVTITGTRIGIEDFILGVSAGGVAVVLYEEIFRKNFYRRNKLTHGKSLSILIILSSLLFVVLIFELKFTSFFACISTLSFFCLVLTYLRKDLFFSALINGILMTLVVLPFYYLLIFLFDGFIQKTYPYTTLSGIKITGIPIEELIFWYVFGFMASLFYEYWQGLRLRNVPSVKIKRRRR